MAHIIFPKRGFSKALRATVDQGHPLAQNLVGCYPCNEGGGLVIHDIARSCHLTAKGTNTWAYRQPDAGFSVDAVNSGAAATAPPHLRSASLSRVSIFWYGVIISNGSLGNNPSLFGLSYNNVNTSPFNTATLARVSGDTTAVYCLWNSNAGVPRNFSTAGILSTGVAVALLMVHDGGIPLVSFYANGVLKNSSAVANTTISDATAEILLNTHVTSATDNVGAHCLMAGIWDRALSAEEANWLAAEPYGFLTPQVPRKRYFFFLPSTQTISPTATLSLSGSLTAAALHKRLYFDSVATGAASPAFDAGWSSTTGALRRRLNHVRQNSALASGSIINFVGTAGTKALDRQYISAPLNGAQTISGTVKMQLGVREEDSRNNVDQLWLAIKVVSNDGGTVRGTLLAHGNYGPTAEFEWHLGPGPAGFPPLYRNKKGADGDALSSVSALDGDRIVVEVGYSNSGAGTSPGARAIWGDDDSDLPEDETTAVAETTGPAGWIEFSTNISFREATILSTAGSLPTAGSLIRQPGIMPAGGETPSGSLSVLHAQRLSAGGTATTAGAAVILQVELNTNAGGITPSGTLDTRLGRGVFATGAAAFSGSLSKIPGIVRGGAAAFAGAIRLTAGKAVGSEFVTTGDLTPLKLFNVVADGTVSLAGLLANTAGKMFSGVLTTTGSFTRILGKLFSGVLTFFGITGITQSTGDVGTCTISSADLIARVYERLGEDAVPTVIGYQGTYYTLTEVTHALTLAQRLFAWLTLSLEHRASFVVSGGQTFPSIRTQIPDFWAPLKVSLQSGPRLLPITLDDLDKYDDDWQAASGTPRYYCMMGFNFMAVYPTPAAPVSLHVTYAAEPQPITPYGGTVEIPTDADPLLVDGALFILRLKEGGAELQSVLQNLDRFVKGAQRYRQYIESRSKGQLYDATPKELSLFDLSRFKFRPPREKKK